MTGPGFRKGRRGRGPFKIDIKPEQIRDFVRDARSGKKSGYRERSLEVHGWICAKCGREFDRDNLHLLTVHHKDGDPNNNPPDGSNWENLCVDCHDDEHSRGMLGDYLQDH